MPLLELTVRGSSARPSVRQRVTLDGRTLVLVLDWNGREGRWYASVLDVDGAPIVCGRKLVAGGLPLRRVSDSRLPGGRLGVVDTDGGGDPGLDDFVARCVLGYVDEATVSVAAAETTTTASGGGTPGYGYGYGAGGGGL